MGHLETTLGEEIEIAAGTVDQIYLKREGEEKASVGRRGVGHSEGRVRVVARE